MTFQSLKYPKDTELEFVSTLRKRVRKYFDTNNLSRFGNREMVLKTIFMVALYLVPYGILVSGSVNSLLLMFILWILMGFGIGGIGLSIMHDANHGSYSRNKRINNLLGNLLNFIGGSATNWKIQHNILHHSYTNVEGHDDDISPGTIMRLSPHQPRKKAHRFQHIYAWFLYGLMTLSWVIIRDFRKLKEYRDRGLLRKQRKSYRRLRAELIFSKVFYLSYVLVIPLIFSGFAWWAVLLGFLSMHFICGFVLAIVFQPAHVMPSADYPLPDEEGSMENSWAVHQVLTTTNFAPDSQLFSWYIGGLNYQIEHHLFPNICHVHYKKISKIVRETAQEYNLPYHSQPTFVNAVWEHAKMLYKLGNQDAVT